MLEFLTRLKSKQAESAISKRDEWLALVVAVCDGDEPEESAVLETLEHVGRTVEDLQQAVELVRQRREWTAQMATAPAAKAEAAAIEAESKAARVELFDAQSKYNARIKELTDRQNANTAILATAEQARNRLGETSTDDTLTTRINKAREDSRPVQERIRYLSEVRGNRRHELKRVERSDNATAEQIEQARMHATDMDDEISRLESEQRRLQAEIEAALAEKLEVMAI